MVISPPYSWQVRFNSSDIAVQPRINDAVDPEIVQELSKKFADFRRAYNEEGLAIRILIPSVQHGAHYGNLLAPVTTLMRSCAIL